MHLTGLEIEKSRRPIGIVDDRVHKPAGRVHTAGDESRRGSAARTKRPARGPLPHRPEEAAIREPSVEGERRRPARQLKADALARDPRRDGLHVRMAHTEGNDRATAGDGDRNLARPVQRVGAGPGTRQLGVGCLGGGAQSQDEWNGDH